MHVCSLRATLACHACGSVPSTTRSSLSLCHSVSVRSFSVCHCVNVGAAVFPQACAPSATILYTAGPADITANCAVMSLPADADAATTSPVPMDLEPPAQSAGPAAPGAGPAPTQLPMDLEPPALSAGPAPTQLPTAAFPVTTEAAGPASLMSLDVLPPLIGEQSLAQTTDEVVMATHMD
eukprot:6099086-Amphidinium_carterae.1